MNRPTHYVLCVFTIGSFCSDSVNKSSVMTSKLQLKKIAQFFATSSLRQRNLIMKHLRVSAEDANKIISLKNGKVLRIPYNQIIKNCEICWKLKVDPNPLENVVNCLQLTSITLKHRITLLHEMGIPIVNSEMIACLSHYMKMPLHKFKECVNIPYDQSIMENMLKHGEISSNLAPVKQLSELLPLRDHYQECLNYYMLHQPIFQGSRIRYSQCRKYKSLGLMTRFLKMLREDFNLSTEFIKKHIYILEFCPDNAQEILKDLRDVKIGGMDIQEVIRKWPGILGCDVNNIIELLQTFKKTGISDEAVRKHIRVFTLKNSTFTKRLKELKKNENIRLWTKYPQFPLLILKDKTVKYRLNYLRLIDQTKSVDISSFVYSRQQFLCQIQQDFTPTRQQYIIYILRKELGEIKPSVIKSLFKHPHWNQVSINYIDKTLRYLKNNYNTEDICKNIHIILYKRARVKAILTDIKNQYTSDEQYNFTNSQWLSLCLYLLEKNNHFTGDGIWQ